MNNNEMFKNTLQLIDSNVKLKQLTEKAISATRIIEENFQSNKKPYKTETTVSFIEALTLQAAEKLIRKNKKTAVLNFANPVEPGGGVWRGANAQEEYLCRASNLYPCLSNEKSLPYYDYHKNQLKKSARRVFLASDRIVYSEGVTVIKVDVADCQKYLDKWYQIDVITCAAPWFNSKQDLLPDNQLYDIFYSRIQNILESAIEYGVEALVLGAFGCGAFHNPPRVVAKVFHDILLEERYRNAFSDVVFAVKRTSDYCENIEWFEIEFSKFPDEAMFSEERNKRRFFE